MKLIVLFVFALATLACNSAQSQVQTGEPVIGSVNPNGRLGQGPDKGPNAASLILRMADAEVAEGAQVCLPVETTGFNNLIGFQYTMRFDSAALQYDSVRKFDLPGYGMSNFGEKFVDRGYLSTLWTDNALRGTNLKEGHRLFEVCFTNLMPKGASTQVKFQDGPTSFEVIDAAMKELRFVYSNGTVISK